jgi:CxxC motif-containing protein
MDLLAKVEVEAPVRIGDKIVENLFGTGVNIVATKNVVKKG